MEIVKQNLQKRIKSLAFMQTGLGALASIVPPAVGWIAGLAPTQLLMFAPVVLLTSLGAVEAWQGYQAAQQDNFLSLKKNSASFFGINYDRAARQSLHDYIHASSDFDEKMVKLAFVNLYLHTHGLRRHAVQHRLLSKAKQSLLEQYPYEKQRIDELCEGHGHGIYWIRHNFHDHKIHALMQKVYPDFHGVALLGTSLVSANQSICWQELFSLQGGKLTAQDLKSINDFVEEARRYKSSGEVFSLENHLTAHYEKLIKELVLSDTKAVQPLKNLLETFREIRDGEFKALYGCGVSDGHMVCESCLQLIEQVQPKLRLEEILPLTVPAKRSKTKL